MTAPTNIPPPRVDIIDPRTGGISREWYRFFLAIFNKVGLGSAALFGATTATSNYTVTQATKYLICVGTFKVYLQPTADRTEPLTVVNAGSGQIALVPNGAETVSGAAIRVMQFRWTSVQLIPISGGYAFI